MQSGLWKDAEGLTGLLRILFLLLETSCSNVLCYDCHVSCSLSKAATNPRKGIVQHLTTTVLGIIPNGPGRVNKSLEYSDSLCFKSPI